MISIITPVFNSGSFIQETYQSIKKQTISDWEWLVIDDNSTDNSIQILEEITYSDGRVKIFNNTGTKGPGNCRNIGIKNAQGKYMTFIDSDDYWFPTFLEISIQTMHKNKCDFTFSSYERWNEEFNIKFDTFIVPTKITYNKLLYTCPISCLTAFIDIEKLGKKFMSDLPKRQDYGLWLDYLKETEFAVGITEPLAKYRIRTGSVSSSKFKLIKYQFLVYNKQQGLNILKSIMYTASWAYHGYFKYKGISR